MFQLEVLIAKANDPSEVRGVLYEAYPNGGTCVRDIVEIKRDKSAAKRLCKMLRLDDHEKIAFAQENEITRGRVKKHATIIERIIDHVFA
jgi:hypothetical protein